MHNLPNFLIEQKLYDKGYKTVVGIDEVGRGPLAGPVVAAAVWLNPQNIPEGLDDSKKLSARKRQKLYDEILDTSKISIATLPANHIDRYNIRIAALRAMHQTIKIFPANVDYALIDGRDSLVDLTIESREIIKGDSISQSIAAASIVAKITRDAMMKDISNRYPHYGFDTNVGYGTAAHLKALDAYGPTPYHRYSFNPLKSKI